jgi:hypothetical protein
MLMTKFAKASIFLFRTVRFQQFQNMKKTRVKFGDLKILGVLKQEEGLKDIKGPRWTKIKQEAEVAKNWTIRFSHIR